MSSAVQDAVWNIVKPPGMTSHDVVNWLRRVIGTRRVGHTGTLDPGAAGVLVCCSGRTTKLIQFMGNHVKEYRAEVFLGLQTDTLDAQGRPVAAIERFQLRREQVAEAVEDLTNVREQVPPMVSAVRVGGRRLYELARQGQTAERPARPVRIYRSRFHNLMHNGEPVESACYGTRVVFDVICSPGTYVRVLVEELGKRLGCGAHLAFLLRMRSGVFTLSEARTLQEIEQAAESGDLSKVCYPPEAAVADLVSVDLSPQMADKFAHGGFVPSPSYDLKPGALARVRDTTGRFLGVGRIAAKEGRPLILKPVRVYDVN